MKKISISAIMLVAAMSSCSQDETYVETLSTVSDNVVSINVAAGTTRGSDVTTSTLETSLTGVKLHIDDETTTGSSYDYDYTELSSEWSTTSSVTWGNIALPAHFFSMHDGESKALTMNNDGTATHDYSVSGESSAHSDLVYHASTLTAEPAGGVVNLYHKHALSKINIYASAGTNKLYIARVTLVNVDGEGSAEITHVSSTDTSDATGIDWTNSGTADDSYVYYYIGSDLTAAPTGITGTTLINSATNAPLMIIPQTTVGSETDNTYVEVIYYMTTSDGTSLVGYSSVAARTDASSYIDEDQGKVLYVMAAFPLGNTFAENKQYNVTLGLGADDTTGGILVTDGYVDKDGNLIELTDDETGDTISPVDIPGLDVGDDILPGDDTTLTIIVTALEWDDDVEEKSVN